MYIHNNLTLCTTNNWIITINCFLMIIQCRKIKSTISNRCKMRNFVYNLMCLLFSITNLAQSLKWCLYPPSVNGNWGNWGGWGSCSVTCGAIGTQNKVRLCNNPAPQNNGDDCAGSGTLTQNCDMRGTNCPGEGLFFIILFTKTKNECILMNVCASFKRNM